MPLPFKEHPLRHALTTELHARTFEPIKAPARVSHLAFICGERGSGRNTEHLIKLLEHFRAPVPESVGQYHVADLGGIRLHWERHTEFVTYTFTEPGPYRHPFGNPVIERLPAEWLAASPGELVSAVSVALESKDMPERSLPELYELFEDNIVIGSEVVGGLGRAWSDLRIHNDGYARILLRNEGLTDAQAGRMVKRVLELNAYRAMTLLALPMARKISRTLDMADRRLAELAAGMVEQPTQTPGQPVESRLLAELTGLAAEIESAAAQTTFRFEASKAYYRVVKQRLEQLRQRRIVGLQTFTEFLDARLAPAVATCESVGSRQRDLAERAARLTALLRARVEVSLQAQNRNLLESMDRRAKLQLRLQETVEGLSVIAIGYYGVGLVGYLLKGLESQGLPINANLGMGIAMPIVVLSAWFFLKRVKKRLMQGHGE
ncbi:DUF3422 family protein [Ectothiorhodospira lacustris]|uniref:DUF3422 family protein n=1 Tax=Ectothiorhodospira lacustris TaxID=2899127 RepID=UPI001EE997A0|nr:DUF3422 domain-containing protein [Ectothiorhodospira lacustris]MCG5500590.1 DUF3422 domain-containing protein [Ectothiorhodospira lacustris]MCG5508783.1 DUF3422 domain-containing protein [Ectothiorhodospira lacustris]MCG5520574.1 DUF3422 domain-containing protein [Ectothiorhodospira lacustris]